MIETRVLKYFFMYACITPTNDKPSTEKGETHLIASIFYSDQDWISKLNFKNQNQKHLIIRVVPIISEKIKDNEKIYRVIKEEQNYVEITLSEKALFKVDENGKFIFPIDKIFHKEKAKRFKYPVLFVFESLNFTYIQNVFQLFNYKLSGGSISQRVNLSTVNFRLTSYLLNMGFIEKDVYESKTFFFNQYDKKINLFTPKNFMYRDYVDFNHFYCVSILVVKFLVKRISKLETEISNLTKRQLIYKSKVDQISNDNININIIYNSNPNHKYVSLLSKTNELLEKKLFFLESINNWKSLFEYLNSNINEGNWRKLLSNLRILCPDDKFYLTNKKFDEILETLIEEEGKKELED